MKRFSVCFVVLILFVQYTRAQIDTRSTLNGWKVVDYAHADTFYTAMSDHAFEGETSQLFGFKVSASYPDGYVCIEKELDQLYPIPETIVVRWYIAYSDPRNVYTDIGFQSYVAHGDTVFRFNEIGTDSRNIDYQQIANGRNSSPDTLMPAYVDKIGFRLQFYYGAYGIAEYLFDQLEFWYPPLQPGEPGWFIPIDYFEGTVTDIREVNNIPNEYHLAQNYPNPFNPSTIIRFSILNTEHVTLTVYNMLGERVATLANKEISSGEHEVVFDASQLSSGTYFYRLSTSAYTETKKMLLIR